MTEQEILVQIGTDPFDTKKIKVNVPKGTKILSTESYVLDLLSMYGIDTQTEEHSKLCEANKDHVTKGEVSFINRDADGNPISALIDIDSKYTATCSLLKESKEIIDQLEIGMILDVKIKTVRGLVTASISGAIEDVKFNEIMGAIGDKSVGFNGKIVELIHGGFWVDLGGIKCFMPGSLAGLNKLWNFDSMVGKMIIVMPLSYSKEKNTIIVSHREYLNTLIPTAVDDLSENIKNKLTGFVTGTTKFGIFAEFNQCLTGMIPANELDNETTHKLNRNEIKPGDEISFWVKEIITDKKIILSQSGPIVDLWDTVSDTYKPMMITTGIVTKITNYGAFVELEKGVSGLIHKSKLKNTALNKGDKIKVKIQGINQNDRKIVMALAD